MRSKNPEVMNAICTFVDEYSGAFSITSPAIGNLYSE